MSESSGSPQAPKRIRIRLIVAILATVMIAGAIYLSALSMPDWSIGASTSNNVPNPTGPLADARPLASAPTVAAIVDDPDTWPNLFGSRHNSVAPEPAHPLPAWGEDGPEELWRVSCGTGYSSPIVWHNRLILLERIDDEEIVSCRDTADGSILWEQRYPTTFECGSSYTSGPYSTPATDGEFVFTLGAQGQLHCWMLADGSPVWSRSLKEEYGIPDDIFGCGHSPLLWGNRLILNVGGTVGDSGIIAFDKHTGDLIWQSTQHGPAFATPVPARIHHRDWLFVLTRTALALLDPETGEQRWEVPFSPSVSDDGYNSVTPLVHGDLVMISAWRLGTLVLRILENGDYEQVWDSKRVLTSQYTPLLARDGYVIGVHAADKSLRCVDLTTGELRWRWKTDLSHSKQIIVGDQILLFGEYGHLGLIACDTQEIVEFSLTPSSLFDGEHRCFSAPAYVGGRLFLRDESQLICLDLLGH